MHIIKIKKFSCFADTTLSYKSHIHVTTVWYSHGVYLVFLLCRYPIPREKSSINEKIKEKRAHHEELLRGICEKIYFAVNML